MLIIPTEQGVSSYVTRVALDGVSYGIELNWNGRAGAWYLSLYDTNGDPLLLSRKLSTNFPILKRFRFIDGLPAGELLAIDASYSLDYAGYDELGETRGVTLYYVEKADLT